ncbi:MAG: type III-B CRISPR module RAMP protein Cmr1 [Flammeovirgaceae bacterium]
MERYLSYDCHLITPMFLHGADPIIPELRAASLKGVLQYWWRAIHPSTVIEKIRLEEALLFGGAKNEGEEWKEVGKSKVRVFIKSSAELKHKKLSELNLKRNKYSVNYLSFGVQAFNEPSERECFIPSTDAPIQIEFQFGNVTDEQFESVKRAFAAFIHFGNLGSKSRNGFGKLFPAKPLEITYQKVLEAGKQKPLANFTAFSKESRCLESTGTYHSWDQAMDYLKTVYENARKALPQKANRTLVAAPIETKINPQDFYVKINDKDEKIDRHAKPYFVSVIPIAQQKPNTPPRYRLRILHLPYNYFYGHQLVKDLPSEQIRLKGEYMTIQNSMINYFLKNGFKKVP